MELRLIKEKTIEVPKINISAETPAVAPAIVAAPVKVDKPVKAPEPAVVPAIAAAPVMNAAPVSSSSPSQASTEASSDSKNEEKPNQATSTNETPKEKSQQAPKAPPKLNDRQSHILLYPCQKCGQPTAFCYMRSIETEKNETQRICVVCFDNYQKAKNATTNVKSGLTNGSTLHKRVTRDALKLIGLFTACILILSVALFFAIRNRSNNKKAAAANISGAMDASGKPAKAGDKLTSGEIGQSGNAATKKANNNSGSSNGSETVSKTAVKSDASAAGAKIADPKTKSTVTNAPNASASTDPKGTRHDLEKAANIKEKTALTNEKDNSPKVAKDGIAKDASGTPIADKKTDGSDTKKTDVLQTEPTKAASATDTVKEIEKLLPVDEKKGASKTADANTENSSDNTSPEKTATPGGRNRSSNHDFSKPTISKEKAL